MVRPFVSTYGSPTYTDPLIYTTDTTLLNFALTLEHLENGFYDEGIKKFSDKDFTAAGYPDFVRRRILQIADHEKAHVQFLSDALGTKAVKPCTYKL